MEPNYKAHLFVCTNDRGPDGKRPSCAHKGSAELRDAVKAACKKFPAGSVRVNNAGCLDQCENGIAAVIYPDRKWLLGLQKTDVEPLVKAVEEIVGK
ncbi:MAG TPA: (2Fe-2S) ferredoxin domain-containing protein [Bdellovibrionota bacterium]|jgi:(2Fe-2S) ferredoxin